MHPTLNIGVKAAREASRVILNSLDRPDELQVHSKSRNDFVTNVDVLAEQTIIDIILQAFPDHAIKAEESGLKGTIGSDHVWIIDPIDGTTNFIHNYPVFAISIAVEIKGVVEHALVYDPNRDELFTASKGGGAHLNSRRIRVSQTKALSKALLATGFPFKELQYLEPWTKTFSTLTPHVSGIRRAGSAALDLAQVACGRFDGYWEYSLKHWDMAAGLLLVQEAGGFVSDAQGGQNMVRTGHVVAGNPALFKKLQTLVKEHTKGVS